MRGRPEAASQPTEAVAPGSPPPGRAEAGGVVARSATSSRGADTGFMTQFRRLCRFLHRDLGYLFFGVTIAYCTSGLALNHLRDWNPNYSITRRESTVTVPAPDQPFKKADALNVLTQTGVRNKYLNHYSPAPGQIRVFFEGGTATVVRESGTAVVEMTTRRPMLYTFNKLHYNPGRWWTWFADVFSVALLVIAITGLFLLRGRQSITRRGGVLVLIGIAIPTVLVLLYF